MKCHVCNTPLTVAQIAVAESRGKEAKYCSPRCRQAAQDAKNYDSRRALTLRAAWAWAVVNAGKRIENRTWTTTHRGTIYIHAGSKDVPADRKEVQRITGRPMPEVIPVSRIVARVELIDVVRRRDVADDPWAVGPFCWILDDVRPITRSPVMPGKQGLWFVPRVRS